jgi:hypothetical protein
MTRDTRFLEISADVEMEFDLDFDDDVGLVVAAAAFHPASDEEQELIVPVDEMVDESIQFHRELGDYAGLYTIAHEMERNGEKAREAAQLMEDSHTAVADLFDIDPDDFG